MRLIEIDIFKALNALQSQGVMFDSGIALSQFYGIEIDDFAHEIALLSLWLAENQMNTVFEKEFGYREPMLPLKASGNIANANSLRVDWEDVCPKQDENGNFEVYVCGNPPFLGNGGRSDEQKSDMNFVFQGFDSFGMLDFVASWFWKASVYIQKSNAEFSFVSTNSISQGDQVPQIWPKILGLGLELKFAHKSFVWTNHAKDKAMVHVVIIGVRNIKPNLNSTLYDVDQEAIRGTSVSNISPYLIEANNAVVYSRTKPLCSVSPMLYGNKPVDAGNLILDKNEYLDIIEKYPATRKWIRKLVGADEFLYGKERYCLWLVGATEKDIENSAELSARVEKVRQFRLASKKIATQRKAETAHLFDENRHPLTGNYLIVPAHSSERRPYIPIGYFDSSVVSTNANLIIPNASLYEFAIMISEAHNDWMRTIAGRLESRYRYSATLVYNNFPWPSVNDEQKNDITKLAEDVLLIREDHPEKSLATLYNPETMPTDLLRAHLDLDKAIDKLYRDKPFENAAERLEFLFKRYEQLIAEEAKNA